MRRRGLSGSKQVRYDLSCSRSGWGWFGVALCGKKGKRVGKVSETHRPAVSRATMILVVVAAPSRCVVVRDAGRSQSSTWPE